VGKEENDGWRNMVQSEGSSHQRKKVAARGKKKGKTTSGNYTDVTGSWRAGDASKAGTVGKRRGEWERETVTPKNERMHLVTQELSSPNKRGEFGFFAQSGGGGTQTKRREVV